MSTKRGSASSKLTQEKLIQRCTVVRDRPDERDWIVAASHPSIIETREPLKSVVDYSKETSDVEDQGDYGSCIGWATTDLREWMYQKSTNGKQIKLSVRFLWMAAKETDQYEINSFVSNAGTSLKTAFQVLKKYGVPEEKFYRYDQDLIAFTSLKQKRDFFYNAAQFRIFNYYQLTTNEVRKLHLTKVGPFVASVPMDMRWLDVGPDGILADENGSEDLGGHAVLVVGYDDNKQRFKFKNSWGKAWGAKGFGYFSYTYAEKNIWQAMGTDLIPEKIAS
ncbi:C1 family peptidase [candidate division KSB1 bacterium]|nr:C1 family peptidase [candidate division KSB1 bacterium]